MDQTRGSQQPQLMRDRRRGWLQQRRKAADAHFTAVERQHDPQPGWVAEQLDEPQRSGRRFPAAAAVAGLQQCDFHGQC
jgi:hypothetical protein